MRRAALILATLAVACSHRAPATGSSGEGVPGPNSGAAPSVDAGAVDGRPRTPPAAPADAELLFAGLESGFAQLAEPVKVHTMRFGDSGLKQGPVLALPRQVDPESERAPEAIASARGDDLYVALGNKLTRFRPFAGEQALAAVAVPDAPESLHAAGDRCFLGLGGRVDLADFSGAQPAVTKVWQSERVTKPVDFFVELPGGRLVAVDDRVFPKYAFVFAWNRGKAPRHLFTTGLPAGANETYTSATAAGDVLAITATYGVMFGTGNRLYRCRFQGEEAQCSTLYESQPGHGYAPPTPEDLASPDMRLLAGKRLSYWNRVGAVGDHLFLCAGARGIMHLPVAGEEAAMVELGGECLDLLTHRDRVIALVRQPVPDAAPARVAARVKALESVSRPAVGTRCTITSTWPDANGTCNARFVCGQATLFGGAAGSSVPCSRDGRGALTIEDMDTTDGDPILRLYGGYGDVTVRDYTDAGDTWVTLEALGAVDDARRELVILRWDSETAALVPQSRHDLPGAMTRLAR